MALNDIDTVVFLMLENRSFDQMLGYLSLDETKGRLPVDGLRSDPKWQFPFANKARGAEYPIRKIPGTQPIHQDPPHGSASIAHQIGTAPRGPDVEKMGGFVESYMDAFKRVDDPGVVMGYYGPKDVPVFDFLAKNFCVCDRWFTSLPLGTQANRLMAMAGESLVVDNVRGLPEQALVYDWLEERKVPWRVYISGSFTPFFIMMIQWAPTMFRSLAFGRGAFRRLNAFRRDWNSQEALPPVIFIEPQYADAPMSDPDDDHPPTPISKGQDLVRKVYETITSNEARWQKTLMIITYDEHGGFFDHVPPPQFETRIGAATFKTLGPRVPALLVSPHVGAGQVFSEQLDHTSVLQLIADRFAKGEAYSEPVRLRQKVMGRIANALLLKAREERPPTMPARPRGVRPGVRTVKQPPRAPDTPNAAAIDAMMRQLAVEHPELIDQPGWSEMKTYLETNAPPVPKHEGTIGDVDEI